MQHLTINRHLGDQNNNKSTFTSINHLAHIHQ